MNYLNTGQTFCADENGNPVDCDGSGQDAEFSPGIRWPEPRFKRDGETVLDRLTGLTWLGNPNFTDFPLTYEECLEAVRELDASRPGGCSGWRMPNRREMFSLISFNDRKPAIPADHPFDKGPLGWYWTSTPSAMQPGYQWYVHTEGGRMFYGRRDGYCLVWPVCGTSDVLADTGADDTATGAAWPEPRFKPQGETVLDELTGLFWTKSADLTSGPCSWKGALAAVKALETPVPENRSGWALPTIRELESLVDASEHSPALSAEHPFADTREAYWSSTSSSFERDWAMCLYLHKGAVGVGFKKDAGFHVWAVSRP